MSHTNKDIISEHPDTQCFPSEGLNENINHGIDMLREMPSILFIPCVCYRLICHAEPLSYSEELASGAQKYADKLARNFKWEKKNTSQEFGENVSRAQGSEEMRPTISNIIENWYQESMQYDGNPSLETEHFTQLAWKGSKEVGCGRAMTRDFVIFVARYSPRGNVRGEFSENVELVERKEPIVGEKKRCCVLM